MRMIFRARMDNLLGCGNTMKKHDQHPVSTKEGPAIFVKEIMGI
jgi:hypothetical protein